MAITIISKKKLAFRNPDASSDKDRFFTVEPLVMATAPDKKGDTPVPDEKGPVAK